MATKKQQLSEELASLKASCEEIQKHLAKVHSEFELLKEDLTKSINPNQYVVDESLSLLRQDYDSWKLRIRKLETKDDHRTRKRPLAMVDSSEVNGVRKFMRECSLNPLPLKSKLTIPSSTRLADRMVYLDGMELDNKPGNPKWILFRECYGEYFEKHIQPTLEIGRNVLITGGGGKNVYSQILALLLVENNEIVLFEHLKVKLLLVCKNPKPEAIAKLKALLSYFEYDPESLSVTDDASTTVYRIDDRALFRDLSKSDHVIFVQNITGDDDDPAGEPQIITIDGRARRIWIASSPYLKKLKDVHGLSTDLSLPPFTIEEILEIRKVWNPNKYSIKRVRDRYSKYGGSVRSVLEEKDT